jgi:hypothetical protein
MATVGGEAPQTALSVLQVPPELCKQASCLKKFATTPPTALLLFSVNVEAQVVRVEELPLMVRGGLEEHTCVDAHAA